ncbi:hypothetical protein BGZ58_005580 [Dissophora ornata]|nr:hypothetical protein BGZ58_005580 [Dissophora ornata]
MTSPVVFDTSPEHVASALLGCFIIFFGLVSLFVKEKMFISEAFVSTVFGIVIGPYAIGIFDPLSWEHFDSVTLEFTRIVIAVQVMAAGVSLPRSYMVKEKRSLFMMIVPLMILMWLTSATLIWALIPDLDFVEAMILAACITPTDPVLSNSVVKGRFAEKHVPPRLRYLLSAESGINDGMGLPFLYLGLYLLRERTVSDALSKWVYMIWAYQILMSIVLGGLIGAAARKLVKGAKNRNLIDKESFLVFSIALALAVTGCVSILASDDLLAVFIAGNVFAWDDWFSNEIAEAHIQEIIDMLLNLACFVYIGASIPFSSFHNLTLELSVWRLVVLAIVVLLFRRMPFAIAMKRFIPALATYREAAFAGWFGPIGVGAVYLSKVAAEMTNPNNLGDNPYNVERLQRVHSVIYPVVMFLVFSSVLIHGVTVPLLHLQYKYTRTWSRKREESSHAVTRLPHINIGDDIVLRPPTSGGTNAVALMESGMVTGSGAGAGDGDLDQRTVGHDQQWSMHQRSLGYGGGFGTTGSPDLSRTNTNNTRTLEDIVQEMKEASRGKGLRSPSYTASGPGAASNGTYYHYHYPLTQLSSTESNTESLNLQLGDGINHEASSPETIESLKEIYQASQGLNIHPSNIRPNSIASRSSGHSSVTISSVNSPQLLHATYQQQGMYTVEAPQPSVSEFREIEREEDNGVVRVATHEVGERDRVRIVRALRREEQEGEGQARQEYNMVIPDDHEAR